MNKARLEAFSDGVIAVIITIMVLELKAPRGDDLDALEQLVPELLTYLVSFVFVGIYWNNHHHLLHTVAHIDGRVLWANMHLLFWLSLVPFTTSWAGRNPTAAVPAALYGCVLLLCGVAWLLLQQLLMKASGPDSALARAVGRDFKGKISAFLYSVGIGLAFVRAWIADAIYVLVAMIWLVPDRRLERMIGAREHERRAS